MNVNDYELRHVIVRTSAGTEGRLLLVPKDRPPDPPGPICPTCQMHCYHSYGRSRCCDAPVDFPTRQE